MPESIIVDGVPEKASGDAADKRAQLAVQGLHEVVLADRTSRGRQLTKGEAINRILINFPGQVISEDFGEPRGLPEN